jgi:hypothetical protein
MDWSKIQAAADGQIKVPKSWVFVHYYEAFNLLFRIENSIRVFVYCVLKNGLGPEWLDANISTDDSAQGTIGSTGKRRLNQANQFKYLGYVSPCPLLYLSMGELVQLMFSEAYWRHFANFFEGKKEIMKAKLDEIIVIRNSFAHFRPLKEDDIDVIRQNAKHALMGIAAYLSNLTQCTDVVPSNSSSAWYKALSTIGSDSASIQLNQCSNEEWVDVKLKFSPPVSRQRITNPWADARIEKLDSPNVLQLFPKIRENIAYLTEQMHVGMNDQSISYWKSLSFVFSRTILETRYNDLADAFRNLIAKITEELDLLGQDDLARGELLSVVEVFGWFTQNEGGQGNWTFRSERAESPPRENDPPEYWGNLGWLGSDFIARRDKYPWMPSAISGVEFF